MESMKALVLEKIEDEDFALWFNAFTGKMKFVVYQGMPEMDKDLANLDLSVRPYNCLKRAGYDTINSFVNDIEHMEDLARIRHMGRKSMYEVMVKLFLFTYENLKPQKRKSYLDMTIEINS